MKIDGAGSADLDRTCSPDRTRDVVARLILETGPQTAVALAERLGISPAGVRRHLDALVDEGLLVACEPRIVTQRGRGRPAKRYALTDTGREAFPHEYDDLATTALRYLRATGGDEAVHRFAAHRVADLESLVSGAIDEGADAATRTTALAAALTAHGYATTVEHGSAGSQLCQHHCPVAHVATEFSELCEAETRVFERVLGTYVQRLATIAHGDGVCTTYVPKPHVSEAHVSEAHVSEPIRNNSRTNLHHFSSPNLESKI